MNQVDKRKKAEATMVDLLECISQDLLDKIQCGEATHQDVANALKLLKDNGITVAINKGEPLDILSETLPFHGDYLSPKN